VIHPHQTPDGHTVTTVLDWTGRDGVNHWGGTLRSCRSCSQPTRLVDGSQRPQHKVCAEREADLALATAAEARQRTAATARPSRARTARRTIRAEAELQAEALW
jgi:hypothetical protein